MKKLQMYTASVALTLLLSAAAHADDGIMQTGYVPPPPPPPTAASTADIAPSDTDGIMQTGTPATDTEATLTAVASALLQSATALF